MEKRRRRRRKRRRETKGKKVIYVSLGYFTAERHTSTRTKSTLYSRVMSLADRTGEVLLFDERTRSAPDLWLGRLTTGSDRFPVTRMAVSPVHYRARASLDRSNLLLFLLLLLLPPLLHLDTGLGV